MEKLTAKEAREKLDKIYRAMETACDFFKNKEDYPFIKDTNTAEERKAIAGFIFTFFEFNEKGEITGLCEPTIELYKKIGSFKGII